MKNASFISQWLDISIPGPTANLELRRIYNSRSAHVGIFGFGWCSSIEKTLEISSQPATLNDCALESEKPPQSIARLPAGYKVTETNEAMSFDEKGRLVKIISREGLEITVTYSPHNRPIQLQTKDGRRIEIKYDASGRRVMELRGSDGSRVRYEYSGNDLIAVIKENRQARLIYDDAHNLVRIDRPDKTYELIEYETALDRVRRYRAVDGCVDTFQYRAVTEKDYVSVAERRCGDHIVGRATYRFRHDSTKNSFEPMGREISGDFEKNTEVKPKNWGLDAIRIKEAQKLAGKDKIIVAIIDTGVDLNAPQLKERLWKNPKEIPNGIDDDHNGLVDDIHGYNFAADTTNVQDEHGHGTHIAGIIAEVAPNAELMILKYYEPGAHLNNMAATVKAIQYATRMGAHIINYSGGGTWANPKEQKALEEAAAKNVFLVAAAGNSSSNNDRKGFYPASYPLKNILPVASFMPSRQLLESSNYGESVPIAAPGYEIPSLAPGGAYTSMSGTSQATAFVTGVAALVLSQNSKMSATTLKRRLVNFSTGAKLDAPPVLANRDASINAFDIVSRPRHVADNEFIYPPTAPEQIP